MMKLNITGILFYCVMIIFSSCKGQSVPGNETPSPEKENTVSVTGKVVSEMDSSAVLIYQDRQDNYWFGSKEGGVYRHDGKAITHFTKKDGLCSYFILGIQEDKLGNIFFDTPECISKYDGQKISTLEVVNTPSTNKEWKLEPDDLWFRMGWGKGGPYRYDGDSLYYLEFPKSDLADTFYAEYPNSSYNPYDIYSWYKDSKGNVWFGTVSLGVCRYDGTSVSWLYEEQLTKTPSGGDFGIRSIVEDKDGYFWFSNSRYRYEILPTSTERNGTDYIDYKRENGVGYSDKNKEIEYPYFMSIVEDNDGNLWLDSDGLWQNNGEQLTPFSIGNRRSNESLISIYKDNNGDLWASVPNDGTYKFNGEAFERFHFEVITK